MATIRIGSGAGYSGDRIEPAAELARDGRLDYLVFECLAERTIALAQAALAKDPAAGYDPLLRERMEAVLPACVAQGVRIITNMGAANPVAAAEVIAQAARDLGLSGVRVAAVVGDDVLDHVRASDPPLLGETGRVSGLGETILSANAYLGAAPIVEALEGGAQVVVTGRVGDPALFLAPMVHAFGWAMDDWDRLGQGTVVGHLLECAGQLTGGYFADPGRKDVQGLARLGFPIAEVSADGDAVLTKVEGSGGRLDVATCVEQLLYEVLDPTAYLQADVAADFTGVRFREVGPDRIAVTGGRGKPRPDRLKATIGYRDGYIGEGQISYSGPGCVARARLAAEIVAERLAMRALPIEETRYDLIGVDAVNFGPADPGRPEPREVRLRVVGRTRDLRTAERIGEEVETLYTNGPAGGGGVLKAARPVIAVVSTLTPHEAVETEIVWKTS